ncbi:hypothetical protein QBC36DRAFT_352065 [Triangularia setosa]|uniref:Zn(2)-C6 fungal-type domain-containing protein n=1 Tax=Triangularia setosa TaxID=2587417 RepID=A0AAN7A733_9PEZI|nr:hypothetical protein QBC36DRAFT_352065 [Podospora setosa]
MVLDPIPCFPYFAQVNLGILLFLKGWKLSGVLTRSADILWQLFLSSSTDKHGVCDRSVCCPIGGSKTMEEQAQRSGSDFRRRKVRKGTHSCWECRRRKIRCQFGKQDDTVCLPCQARGSVCRSQEFVDAQPLQLPDRRLAQRLARLEDLVAKVVDRVMPEAGSGNSSAQDQSRTSSPTPSDETLMSDVDGQEIAHLGLELMESPINHEASTSMLMGIQDGGTSLQQPMARLTIPSRRSTESVSSKGLAPRRYEKMRRVLQSLFPSQHNVNALAKATPAPYFLVALFHNYQDIMEGLSETPESIATIPPQNAHPTVLAKRLIQLCICIQQQPPGSFALRELQPSLNPYDLMDTIVSTVSQLVTSNDDLVGTAEGLQCLILLGHWHSNAGNIRKAWLIFRKALSLATMMGLNRNNTQALKFVDSSIHESARPSPMAVWYCINAADRNLSLMLGLPAGSPDNAFAIEEAMARDNPRERFTKIHTVIAKRILDHNLSVVSDSLIQKAAMSYQQIDRDLEHAAKIMPSDWWFIPTVPSEGQVDLEQATAAINHVVLQVSHFNLSLLLHLPYIIHSISTGTSIEDDHKACLGSARQILQRYLAYHSISQSSPTWTCYQVSYAALMASTALCLFTLTNQTSEADIKLVSLTLSKMQHLALLQPHNKLSQSSVTLISQLLDMIDSGMKQPLNLNLNLPFFGLININPRTSPSPAMSPSGQPGTRRSPSSSAHSSHMAPVPATSPGPPGGSLSPHPRPPRGRQRNVTVPIGFHTSQTNPSLQQHAHTHQSPITGHGGDGYHNMHHAMQFDAHQHHQQQPQRVDNERDSNLGEIPMVPGGEDWVFTGIEPGYWNLMNQGL